MEENDVEFRAEDLAEAFGVKPDTIGSWSREGRLAGTLPRGVRKLGRRYSYETVFAFVEATEDGGYTKRQFERWWRQNRGRFVKRTQEDGEVSTNVLCSIP